MVSTYAKLMVLAILVIFVLLPASSEDAAEEPGTLSISGRVYDDSNGDGVRGADEPGLEGWETLLLKPDGGLVAQETDRKGYYIFTGLLPGSYKAVVNIQENWTATSPDTGVKDVELVDAHESEIDFGFELFPANQISETTGLMVEPELKKVIGTPSSEMRSVAFSPDGRILASSASNSTMTLWDVETGLNLQTTQSNPPYILDCAAFYPDGRILGAVVYDFDDTFELWDMVSGKRIWRLYSQNISHSPVFSPDGRTMAVTCSDNAVKLFDVEYGTELRTLTGHSYEVTSVAFSPDGCTLASASGSHPVNLKLWDVESGKELQNLSGLSQDYGSTYRLAISPDGHTLASGGSNGKVTLWDVTGEEKIRPLAGHQNYDEISSVAFSPDGRTLASASNDGTVKLWDVESGTELHTLSGHSDSVTSVAFSPDGHTLASASFDRTMKLWDVKSGSELRTLSNKSSSITSVAFSPDSHTLASGAGNGTIKLWDVESGTELRTLSGPSDGVSNVAFSPDGRTLASLGTDFSYSYSSFVTLWDVKSGKELTILSSHNDPMNIAFSPDGRTLASASNSMVELWDVLNGSLTRTLEGRSDYEESVAFSPDGRILASGGFSTLTLWDVENGIEIRTLPTAVVSVNLLAFSPDSRILASGGEGHLELWDVENGTKLQTLDTIWANSVAFSTDGHILASGNGDGTIRVWQVA